ncbi:MAG TPA: hypothetical protein VNH18_25695 [Bryobacteraceae bacterium]|nr:hypothetical protein [Bryobacteraceae bacterium]
MRILVFLMAAGILAAQPRVDNVLVRMVPPGATSLVGGNMDRIKATVFYGKLLDRRKMPQVDKFAEETGFDPRRDVRELLYAGTPAGSVMLARGKFQLKVDPAAHTKLLRHGVYNIWTSDNAGFCILDSTLAVAGETKAIEAALDEWTRGRHKNAAPLLAQAKGIVPTSPLWGVSTGFAAFLANTLPKGGPGGVDFSKVFAGMKTSWFQADFADGLKMDLRGTTATGEEAISLRDMAKGLIGFGRLSVPENQPEMLKLWDGITVEQEGQAVAIKADISQNLVDQVIRMLNSGTGGRGRAGSRSRAGSDPNAQL